MLREALLLIWPLTIFKFFKMLHFETQLVHSSETVETVN